LASRCGSWTKCCGAVRPRAGVKILSHRWSDLHSALKLSSLPIQIGLRSHSARMRFARPVACSSRVRAPSAAVAARVPSTALSQRTTAPSSSSCAPAPSPRPQCGSSSGSSSSSTAAGTGSAAACSSSIWQQQLSRLSPIVQSHTISCNLEQSHAISCNLEQSHGFTLYEPRIRASHTSFPVQALCTSLVV
jgi:hypothetical protein